MSGKTPHTSRQTGPKTTTINAKVISALAVVASLFLQGCAPQSKPGYFREYESAILEANSRSVQQSLEGQDHEKLFRNMEMLFSDLKHPDLEQRIRRTYAPSLYFNDTLRTYRTLEEVVDYLLETANRVTETKAQFEEISSSNESYFIRWKMIMKFSVNGETIETESIGVSQIKFDSSGKVIFHQDFWDNTEGFFRHLPLVGYVLDKTIQKL